MTPLRISLFSALSVLAACGDGGSTLAPDAGVDAGSVPPDGASGCDPASVLPTTYRPIATASNGLVEVTTSAGVTAGTLDATAGGAANAADQPYLYVDLRTGEKIAISDLDARGATSWDLALKRSSLRINGGDSGPGDRHLAVVAAATLDEVTEAPATGYATDDFTTDDCMLASTPGGEPMSAFGEWYDYDPQAHTLSPKSEVYVLERTDGTRTAFRIVTYYGDQAMPMRGALYRVEWKQLPAQ